MVMDIVERLRDAEQWNADAPLKDTALFGEAANEIERLREYLNRIASIEGGDVTGLWKIMRDHARAALKEGE